MELIETSTLSGPKSTHQVDVFPLGPLLPHGNADSLSVVKIGDSDYVYVARTEDWAGRAGKLVAWVPPDSLVDVSRPEFSFLAADAKYEGQVAGVKNMARIKAKRLRGVVSYGLLVLAPEGLVAGDDAAEALGVVHYDADDYAASKSGKVDVDAAKPPACLAPKYDVDSFLKYGRKLFVPGELVSITEKVDGENFRVVCDAEGIMHVGSRNLWKKEMSSPPNLTVEGLVEKGVSLEQATELYRQKVLDFQPKPNSWWTTFRKYPGIEAFCRASPGHVVFGEMFSHTNRLKYAKDKDCPRFVAFDIMTPDGGWLSPSEFHSICYRYGIPVAPIVAEIPFNFDDVARLANRDTLLGTGIAEGVVVKPVSGRCEPTFGRLVLKVINPAYLELK